MMTFLIIFALVEWLVLSLVTFTYILHTVSGDRSFLFQNLFWSAIWPVSMSIWFFQYVKDGGQVC